MNPSDECSFAVSSVLFNGKTYLNKKMNKEVDESESHNEMELGGEIPELNYVETDCSTRPNQESLTQRRKRHDDDFQKVKKRNMCKISRIMESVASTSVSTENRFQPLTSVDTQITQQSTSTTTKNTENIVTGSMTTPIVSSKEYKKPRKPKPIILITKIKYFRIREIFQQMFSELPTCQLCPKGLKIQAHSEEDAQKLIKYLMDPKMEFYTFVSREQKTIKVVMRGLPVETPTDDIERQLKELKYPVESVRQMKRRIEDNQTGIKEWQQLPLWIVTVYDIQNSPDIRKLTGLYNLRINFSDYIGQGGPQQCYNCQGFGHKASGCHILSKCVRCGKNHPSKECNKDPLDPPKCANCNKDHPSNYRLCEKFLAYTNGRKTRPGNSFQPRVKIQNENEFPPLPVRERMSEYESRQTPFENREQRQTSVFQELKDMMVFMKSMMQGFRTVLNEMKTEPDPLSRIIILAEGLSSIFENGNY